MSILHSRRKICVFIGLYFQHSNLTWNKKKFVRETNSSYKFKSTLPYLIKDFIIIIFLHNRV